MVHPCNPSYVRHSRRIFRSEAELGKQHRPLSEKVTKAKGLEYGSNGRVALSLHPSAAKNYIN
jgi:hypothetical protein